VFLFAPFRWFIWENMLYAYLPDISHLSVNVVERIFFFCTDRIRTSSSIYPSHSMGNLIAAYFQWEFFFFQFFRRRHRHTTCSVLYLETCLHGPLYSYVPRMSIHLLPKQLPWLFLRLLYTSYLVLYRYWNRICGSCTVRDAEQLGWMNGGC
jgi:hypothetical protein